ncbi:MAG TPA: hypothetical protein VJ909_03340, partial [Prolixibacteraceae bacterium]|nr:hypothetical protein [Prolixibacteraceae bacterium]
MTQINIYQPDNDDGFSESNIQSNSPESTTALKLAADKIKSDYFFMQIKTGTLIPEFKMMADWLKAAQYGNSILGYSDYLQVEASTNSDSYIPTIDCQTGSIRDNFNFGALVLVKTKELHQFISQNNNNWKYGGFYAFRLWVSRKQLPVHYPKACYKYAEPDLRYSGQKQFDYVDPRNRERQIEMEQIATLHLEAIGAKVSPPFKEVNFGEQNFETEASV